MSLNQAAMVGFVGVKDADAARHFYRDILGLTLVEEQLPFALIFDTSGSMLRVTLVGDVKPQPYTVLGWDVGDIRATVLALKKNGVTFQIIAGLNDSDESGIWAAPGGAQIAWFKDPDGNMLSVSQMAPR